MKINIKFLGSGSAFVLNEENYHSNILISVDNNSYKKLLLFDAGTTIDESLNESQININDIDTIYISHNHSDHSGGMEYIGFKRFFSTFPFGINIPNLIGHKKVIKELWNDSLKAGMRTMQNRVNCLNTYFNPTKLKNNQSFNFNGVEFKLIQSIHVVNDGVHSPNFGLIFSSSNKKVFITGDCQFAPNQLITFYEDSDIIFQDSEFKNYPGGVHAQFHQLCTLPEKIKKKMWLYHYTLVVSTEKLENGFEKPIYEDFKQREKLVLENGFAGLVKKGESFNI